MAYPIGDMSWKLFENIVGQLPSSTVIVPFFRGESLLHPRFTDAMEKLSKFNEVQLATNGDFLKNPYSEIIDNCSFISLSLHNFETPCHDKFFLAAKKRGVTTQVSILEMLIPQGKKQAFVDAWLGHVDRVRVYVEHSKRGFGDVSLLNVPYIEEEDLPFNFTAKPFHLAPCQKPFEDMVVYWDGMAGLCNHDWNNGTYLGNLNTQSIREVWQGIQYKTVRKLHSNGKRCFVESCRNCDYWMTSYLPNKMFGELYTN